MTPRPIACSLLMVTVMAAAAHAAEPYVPQVLEPWRQWVLDKHKDHDCPTAHDSAARSCTWTSSLSLDLDQTGGRFVQRTTVFAQQAVRIPGDSSSWPLEVSVDGRAAVVTRSGDTPRVTLDPGKHSIEGRFLWRQRPDDLGIPSGYGVLDLRLDGSEVARPQSDHARLYLGERARGAEAGAEDRLVARVYRRVDDSVPLTLTTQLNLEVSGRAREITIGPAQLPGFVEMRLQSPVPARLESDGNLRLFVEPGTLEVDLVSRYPGPVNALRIPASTGGWPEQEVWVYAADRSQRVASVEGVNAIDASQTGLPASWRNFPAYLMTAQTTMTLVEEQRGDESPAPDSFTLERDLWLDFQGDGFTARDHLNGTVNRARRIQYQVTPGRVEVNGTPMLVTRLSDDEPAGVQLPQGAVDLVAVSHLPKSASLAAIGWDIDVQRLNATLHLPPGWELLGTSGVDLATGAWVQKWSLWNVFLVLLLTVATARLLGWTAGGTMFAALVLGYHVRDAPVIVWLFAVGALGLLRVLPPGALQRITRLVYGGVMIIAALAVLTFAIDRVRIAIYPQLEQPFLAVSAQGPGRGMPVAAKTAMPSAPAESATRELGVVSASKPPVTDYSRVQPGANVQTGPGEPRWSWEHVALLWNGPVKADQPFALHLLPPMVMRPLYVLMAALFGLLFVWFVMELLTEAQRPRWMRGLRGVAGGAVALLLLHVPAAGHAAQEAQDVMIDPGILKELETRLTAPPDCLPACAGVERAHISLSAQLLRIQLDVHAAARIWVPLPGSADNWNPRTVMLDGLRQSVLGRDAGGQLEGVLEPGRHQIVLEGPVTGFDQIRLPFALQPGELQLDVDGWTVNGVVDEQVRGQAITFERIEERQSGPGTANLTPEPVPPFVQVQRTLHLGIAWRVDTVATRIAPPRGPISLTLPLIPGESVLSEDVPVKDGRATVVIPPGARSVRWQSSLEPSPTIELTAGPMNAYQELWYLDAASMWHVQTEGFPPVKQPGATMPLWQPWPGEHLLLDVRRPEAVEGPTRTVEWLQLSQSPGGRATDSTLTLMIRASQGGSYAIALPEGAALRSIVIDGQEQPMPADTSDISLPLHPGEQNLQLTWQTPEGIGTLWAAPTMSFPSPINNIELSLALPRSRWPLAVAGPEIGPAMLFWGVLVVIVGAAFGLGRFRGVPLPTRDWLLLGIGMSTCNLPSILLVVIWLFALHGRERWADRLRSYWQFDLAQIGLGLLTLAAIIALLASIPLGLLGSPNMQVTGNGSSDYLYRWYQDRTPGALPAAWLITAPIWIYRGAMLAWSLWLSFALLRWLRWGWQCFGADGLWRSKPQIVAD